MNHIIFVSLALVACASGDVSHLSNKYLPPTQSFHPPSIDYLPPVQQTYNAPAIQSTYNPPAVSYSPPAVSYSPPAVSYSPPAAPSYNYAPSSSISQSIGYATPSVQRTYSTPIVQQSYSAPSNEYLPPLQTSTAGQALVSLSRPSFSYSTSAVRTVPYTTVGSSYSAPSVSYATAAAPSVNYLPPSQATIGYATAPAIQQQQQTYTVPTGGYSGSSIDLGTQYAANGGYVYKKK